MPVNLFSWQPLPHLRPNNKYKCEKFGQILLNVHEVFAREFDLNWDSKHELMNSYQGSG